MGVDFGTGIGLERRPGPMVFGRVPREQFQKRRVLRGGVQEDPQERCRHRDRPARSVPVALEVRLERLAQNCVSRETRQQKPAETPVDDARRAVRQRPAAGPRRDLSTARVSRLEGHAEFGAARVVEPRGIVADQHALRQRRWCTRE